MKKILFILTAIILFMTGCTSEPEIKETQELQSQYEILSDEDIGNYMNENNENSNLTLSVNGTPLSVKWEKLFSADRIRLVL